jgi:SSS family solute:Na+ symporter
MLTTLDYVLIVAYLSGTLWLGFHIGKRVKSGSDFFLAGRRLPWWAVGMSLVATDIGGVDIIGGGGAAYKYGLAIANFEWIGCVPAMIVGAFVFIPAFYRAGVTTIPEFLERRYNAGVRSVMAFCWLVFMACNLGIMLLASAKLMSAMFGWNPAFSILLTAILVGFYTCAGGLEAVVYTDVLQCVVMIGGCLLTLAIGLYEVGGPTELVRRIEAIDAQRTEKPAPDAPAEPATSDSGTRTNPRLTLILPVDTPTPFPWPGVYFGLALILSPAYWVGNQAIVQRTLGAKSEFEAKASYVWGAVLKNVIPLIVAVPGLIALALIPDLKDGDTAIPRLVAEILPSGVRGVFVAAFLAALMSSVDSYLNSAATIVSLDIYKRFVNPQVSETQLLKVGRITTVCLVVWAIGFAFLLTRIEQNSGIYTIFQTLMAFFQGPAFAILLAGVFWKRATGSAALTGLLCGIATSVGLFALNHPVVRQSLKLDPLFQISDPFLYFSIWAFLVTMVVLVTLSLLRPQRKLMPVASGS